MIRVREGERNQRQGRAETRTVLDFLRPGDALTVTRIDRLARSIGRPERRSCANAKSKGVALKATEQPIETRVGRRQGIHRDAWRLRGSLRPTCAASASLRAFARPRKAGVYKGRPAKIEAQKIAALKAEGLGASEIARRLGDRSRQRVGRENCRLKPPQRRRGG